MLLQCILSIFPASVHQFYANILVFININPFLYINDQFALIQCHLLSDILKWVKKYKPRVIMVRVQYKSCI